MSTNEQYKGRSLNILCKSTPHIFGIIISDRNICLSRRQLLKRSRYNSETQKSSKFWKKLALCLSLNKNLFTSIFCYANPSSNYR